MELTALDERLARVRWGLKFVHPEAEAGYRAWHQRVTIPFTRAGMILSLLSWAVALALQLMKLWPGAGSQTAVLVLVVVPVIAAALFTTYRPALRPWTLPLTALANALAGLYSVWVSVVPVMRLEFASVSITIVGFFGFTIFRLPPLRALISVGSYYGALFGLVLWQVSTGDLSWTSTIVYGAGFDVSFSSGLAACLLLDRLSRDSYAQEEVILAQRKDLEQERNRADALLHSILPESIAERLKKSPQMIAEQHPAVTVLFADIVGFTPMAAALSADQLVNRLNQIFTSFDELAARLGAEKIKTIGDAYMAVAGAPESREDHAQVMAELALGMLGLIRGMKAEHRISIRIGLSSGPAVAGVIGARKFAYDLWGDTVNTAARMESHGTAGGIHISEATRQQLDGRYLFEDRGIVEIKGKGPMRTWLLTGRAPE